MPVFAADPAGHSGLDLLASAALSSKPSGATPRAETVGPVPHHMQYLVPSPFNPVAMGLPRIAKRILDQKFVEITAEDDLV